MRTGLARATGDFVIIQDADLEYDPNDYVPMLKALLSGAARYHLRQPLPEAPRPQSDLQPADRQAPGPILDGVPRRTEPQLHRASLHWALPHRHGHGAQALPPRHPQRTPTRNHRVRARPRDHGEGARPGLPYRGSAHLLPPAEPRGRQEDRPARLVHRAGGRLRGFGEASSPPRFPGSPGSRRSPCPATRGRCAPAFRPAGPG